jgi:hypothetical protein
MISSRETLVFTKDAVRKVFSDGNLMAFITPTTTMMREGIMQSSTKVDSGWSGVLNWGLRNSSIKDFILGYGEPIFKLTIFLLEGEEVPEVPYGQRQEDRYQGTEGIARSNRKIPADIPQKKIVSSSSERLDPARQLREAGYPFDHISTELTDLHGKFQVVSTDVLLLKTAIEQQGVTLSAKVDESQKTTLAKVEAFFEHKFYSLAATIAGCVAVMYATVTFFQAHGITGNALGWVSLIAGFGMLSVVALLSRRKS